MTLLQARALADLIRSRVVPGIDLETAAASAIIDRLIATPNGRTYLLGPDGAAVRRWLETFR